LVQDDKLVVERGIALFSMIGWFRKYPVLAWIAAGILTVGLVLAIWFLPRQFAEWQQRRLLASAQAFLQLGDLRSATVSCQQLIRLDPNSIGAYRLLIAIDEKVNSPRSITWASKIATLSGNDPNSLIEVIAQAIKFGETETAQEALNRLPATWEEAPVTLSLRATIEVLGGRLSTAESLFDRAAKLDPSNYSYRLNLLKIRLQSKDNAKADAARLELERLTNDSIANREVLRALLQNARAHGQFDHALSIAQRLVSMPNPPLSDRLLLLEELRVSRKDQFSVDLAELQETIQASGDSGLIFQLMSWQNSHGLYQESLDWKLPPELADRLPIPLAEAEALIGVKDWAALRKRVVNADWGWMNYLRLAVYARVERELGTSRFPERWESALVATGGEWNAMMELANLAERWGWKDQAAQAYWIIARQPQGQRIALKRLYRMYSDERNTRELYKVAKRILEIDPQDLVAVNNVASLGLLLDEDRDIAAKLAEDVYQKAPSIAAFQTTYAFALVKARQPQKALQILKAASADAANDPSIGLYYGLTLAADGKDGAARPYLQTALQSNHLFPEEITLAQKALANKDQTP
jgi:tetratricopeptide (TPR) repeat protein